MTEKEVTWKCPRCGRLILHDIYMRIHTHTGCACGESWLWQFDQFIIDKDDTIGQSYSAFEKMIKKMLNNAREDGVELGYFIGKTDGYDVGYKKGYKDGIMRDNV